MQKQTSAVKPSLQELQWKDVRDSVKRVNAPLCRLIDEIDPGSKYTLFKAVYPFGTEILRGGPLLLPDEKGNLIFMHSPEIPQKIKEKLNYNENSNPVTMLIKNTAEICMVFENVILPLYGLINTGKLFGTWKVISKLNSHTPISLWTMTAGARSLFMLPKITDTGSYNRLRQVFQLDTEKPKKLLDHWYVFREIANHSAFSQTWETEMLFFPKIWFEHLDDPVWQKFKLYLLDTAWKSSEFFRNEFMWDMIFSMIQNQRGIKPDPYIADTVRHLLAISIGAQPGFAPAVNDEAGPIKRLQEVFTEIYRIDYAPIMMQPAFLNSTTQKMVYYSFEYPTMTRFSPKSREKSSKIAELYGTMRLLDKYISDIREDKYHTSDTSLFEATQKVHYDFFHPDSHKYSTIQSHRDIQKNDPVFREIKNFPVNSAFLAGCVRLSYK